MSEERLMNRYNVVGLWTDAEVIIECPQCEDEYYLDDFGCAAPISGESDPSESDYLLTDTGAVISVLCCPYCGEALKVSNP